MLTLVNPIPYNGISWTIGWIVVWLFAFKCFRIYRVTRNPLAGMYCSIALLMGTSFFFFGVPNLFTQDPNTLLKTYYLADLFAQLGILAQSRLLWFIGFKNKFSWWVIALPTLLWSITILLLETRLLPSHVVVDTGARLVLYIDQAPVLYMKSMLYAVIAFPISYFFIRQGFTQKVFKAKINSIAAGLVFLFVSTSSIQNALFTNGSDTKQTCITNAALFLLFQLVSSSFTIYKRLSTKRFQTSSGSRP